MRYTEPMNCQRAIIYYKNSLPESYTLIIEGMGRSGSRRSAEVRETTFSEAYDLFPTIRKNWNADGTAKV